MRNKYKGKCYLCGKEVKAGEGHFQRKRGGWLVRCLLDHGKCIAK